MTRILLRRMHRQLGRRHREDSPTMPGVHGCKAEDVLEGRAVRSRVLAVHDHMSTEDHERLRLSFLLQLLLAAAVPLQAAVERGENRVVVPREALVHALLQQY